MAMQDLIIEYIKDEYLEEDDVMDLDTSLITSGIVESFSMVSLKTFLENKYNISIPDEKAAPEAFDTVRKIIDLVHEFNPDAE